MTAVQTTPVAAPETRVTAAAQHRGRSPGRSRLLRALPLLIALLAVVLRAVNLSRAYDLFIDEPFYLDVGRAVADGGFPSARGEYFFLHPPGFFLLEAAWMKVFGTSGDLFDQVFRLRYLNVLLSGANVLLLWAVARRLGGVRAAVVAALIYALDPWIIRQNSFVLLETATLTWVLAGYLLLLSARAPPGRGGRGGSSAPGSPSAWAC